MEVMKRPDLMVDGAPPNTYWLVCQECGRATEYRSSNEQLQWWLVSGREGGGLVVACPQHITEWRLRVSGLGRTHTTAQWAAEAKAQDKPPPKPFAEPFPAAGKTNEMIAADQLTAEGQGLERDHGVRY